MGLRTRGGGVVVAILPTKRDDKKTSAFNIRIPATLADRLTAVAEATGYSRNDVIARLLLFGLEAHEAETKGEPKKKG